MTGIPRIHLLETSELDACLPRLMGGYGVSDAARLIEREQPCERVALTPAEVEAWRPRVEALFARLDDARASSPLRESPPQRR